jgi:hypothetical protein
MNRSGPELSSNINPPEQVTLVYCTRDGVHSFSILEISGLIVLDHDLERAFAAGVKGAGELVSAVCDERVEYDVDLTFEQFKQKIAKQVGTANTHRVVTVPCEIHRLEAA